MVADRKLTKRVLSFYEGWEPLCRFLDKPIPEGKLFPHLNERASFSEFAQRLIQGKVWRALERCQINSGQSQNRNSTEIAHNAELIIF